MSADFFEIIIDYDDYCLDCDKQIITDDSVRVGEHDYMCYDCAFKMGLITEKEYIDNSMFSGFRKARAKVHEGEIYVDIRGNKFPFERTNYDYRHGKDYEEWRHKVYERDHYTCQKCGQVGGTLNAHHIKHFKDYPKLRYELSNGITLCEKCHRELHKNERKRLRKDSKKKHK